MKITLTDHAILRYSERLKSIHDPTPNEYRYFKFALEKLIESYGVVTDEEPQWIGIPPEDVGYIRRAQLYVVISEDICIPVEECNNKLLALTVLTRGSISDTRRQMRNESKKERRARRSASRQNKAWLGERAPRWR